MSSDLRQRSAADRDMEGEGEGERLMAEVESAQREAAEAEAEVEASAAATAATNDTTNDDEEEDGVLVSYSFDSSDTPASPDTEQTAAAPPTTRTVEPEATTTTTAPAPAAPTTPTTPVTPATVEGKEDDKDDLLASTLTEVMVKKVTERYPMVEEALIHLAPVAKKMGEGVELLYPHVHEGWVHAKRLYNQCPFEVISAILGLLLCFFGGAFVTTIAAAEAFRLCGGSRTMRHIRTIYRDYQRFKITQRQHKRQNPGNAMNGKDTLFAALRSVRDPDRLTSSVSGIYTAVLAMFTTLRLQFARTITLGAAIGETIKNPVLRFVSPSVERLVEQDFKKWVAPATEWGCRFLGVSIAFYAQRVLAAVQSSLRGGQMCVSNAAAYLRGKQIIPTTTHDATIDNLGGYALALLGMYFQLHWGYVYYVYFLLLHSCKKISTRNVSHTTNNKIQVRHPVPTEHPYVATELCRKHADFLCVRRGFFFSVPASGRGVLHCQLMYFSLFSISYIEQICEYGRSSS